MAGLTLFCQIFVKDKVNVGVVYHEMVHVRQQEADGWRFYLRYVFSPEWRVKYEAEAYAVNVIAHDMTLDAAATLLSGRLYLWPCSYQHAVLAILRFM